MNRMLLLASLISTHFALWGADAMIAAYAEDAPQISGAKGAEVQRQGATGAGGSSEGNGVDTTTVRKSDLDSLGGAAVRAHGKANFDDNPAKVGGSNTGDHQTGLRGAAAEREMGSEDARHSDSHTGADHGGTEVTPIDTRFTIGGARRSSRWLKAHDWKRFKAARTSGYLRYGLNSARGTKGGVVRNAIGLAVEVKKPAINDFSKSTKPLGSGETQAGRTDFRREGFPPPAQTGAVRPHDALISTALNRSIVDGRDLVRPGSGSGAIGGAAKNVVGVIDGARFRPRHP